MRRGETEPGSGEYKCAQCGEIFKFETDDAVAEAEAIENGFGNIPEEQMAIVCDDCYKQVMGSIN